MAKYFIFNLLFSSLFIYIYAFECPKYTCKSPEQVFLPETCMTYNEFTNTWYFKKCSDPNHECKEDSGFSWPKNYTCSASTPTPTGISGKFCNKSDDCPHFLPCKNGICALIPEGGICKEIGTCEAGTNCDGQFCVPQIKIGGTGCRNIYDCVNSASCNISSLTDPAQNICYAMMSFNVHDRVGNCHSGMNELCPYLTCSFNLKDGGYYCTDLLSTAKGEGAECNPNEDDGSCDSLSDEFFEPPLIVKGQCFCSYNSQGTAHCSPLYGDPAFLQINKQISKWIESEDILKCNTVERFDDECLKTYWNTKDYNAFNYYSEIGNNLQAIIGAEDCVIETLTSLRSYWEAKKNFDNDANIDDDIDNEINEPEP